MYKYIQSSKVVFTKTFLRNKKSEPQKIIELI